MTTFESLLDKFKNVLVEICELSSVPEMNNPIVIQKIKAAQGDTRLLTIIPPDELVLHVPVILEKYNIETEDEDFMYTLVFADLAHWVSYLEMPITPRGALQ